MAYEGEHETYSNDYKQKKDVFALPQTVLKPRKAFEAGICQENNQQQKRPHLYVSSNKKEARENDLANLQMKRTRSDYPTGGKTYTSLF
jgi:hypothetical protein